jgi:hypothetical protein
MEHLGPGDGPGDRACLAGHEALDEECWPDPEQLPGHDWLILFNTVHLQCGTKFCCKVLSGCKIIISAVAGGGQRNGQLHPAHLLQAGVAGGLQVGDWAKAIIPFAHICRWKSYTAPEKTVLMTNVQVQHPYGGYNIPTISGQCLPAVPASGEQAWLDAGELCCTVVLIEFPFSR